MTDHFITTNHINLHYIEYPATGKPVLVLLHGLTANAHAFDGLIAKGLNDHYHIVAPDLRGRGLSDKPAFCYTLEDHARDILGLLDHLDIEKAWLAGHSYGAYLSIYLASHYPARVEKIVLLDAAAEMNPNAAAMLMPSLSRLDKNFPSYETYITEMKAAPQNTFWDESMESYYAADGHVREDGTVNPYPNYTNIIEVSMAVGSEPWKEDFAMVKQPAVLINALDEYTLGEPLLPDFKAKETVEMMHDCYYVAVDGNHQTMLYGANATQVVKAIVKFLE